MKWKLNQIAPLLLLKSYMVAVSRVRRKTNGSMAKYIRAMNWQLINEFSIDSGRTIVGLECDLSWSCQNVALIFHFPRRSDILGLQIWSPANNETVFLQTKNWERRSASRCKYSSASHKWRSNVDYSIPDLLNDLSDAINDEIREQNCTGAVQR